jgi:hypothetical protein
MKGRYDEGHLEVDGLVRMATGSGKTEIGLV